MEVCCYWNTCRTLSSTYNGYRNTLLRKLACLLHQVDDWKLPSILNAADLQPPVLKCTTITDKTFADGQHETEQIPNGCQLRQYVEQTIPCLYTQSSHHRHFCAFVRIMIPNASGRTNKRKRYGRDIVRHTFSISMTD
jgi:hypothetical protein